MAVPERVEVELSRHDSRCALSTHQAMLVRDLRLVFNALNDKHWDWRTLPGLARATKLPEKVILNVLQRHADKVEIRESEQFGMIVRRRNLKMHSYQLLLKTLDQILDYVSFGKRRIVEP